MGCKILWCGKYKQNWDVLSHRHAFHQLFSFQEGTANFTLGDTTFPVERGCIIIVKPDVDHQVKKLETGKDLSIVDIKFTVYDNLLKEEITHLSPVQYVDLAEEIGSFLDFIIYENRHRDCYTEKLINDSLYRVLVSLIRLTKEDQATVYKEDSSLKLCEDELYKGISVSSLLNFIQENYFRQITIAELSREFYTNDSTIFQIFRKYFDTTPIKFINQVRFKKASTLLSDTSLNVSEIAGLVGFQSIQYFCRSFKKHTKLTPLEYRAHCAENQYFTFS